MATSGVTSGLMPVRDIVATALELVGVLGTDEDIAASDFATSLKHLNWMLKGWQQDGANLWRDQDVQINWPADISEVQLNTNATDVTDTRIYVSGHERSLARWERDQYAAFPNKGSKGSPVAYSLVTERDQLRMRLWPIPTTNLILIATVIRRVEDVTSGDHTLDLPQDWSEAVIYNLADRLSNVFGARDPNVADVKSKAGAAYQRALTSDRPSSFFFEAGW